MKKVLIALLGSLLMFAFACSKRPGHVTTHLIARTGEKTITIAVSDDGFGGYIVEASIPNKAYLKKGHRAHWVVINNTERAIVNSVVIDSFRDPDGHTDPFEGTSADQTFKFGMPDGPAIGPGDDNSQTSNKAKPTGGPARHFKYKVTVRIAGVAAPLVADPEVVVGD